MSKITKIWENVERCPEYYERRDVFPDPGVVRYLPPLKQPEMHRGERSKHSILCEELQWIRIDMQIRLLKQRMEEGRA